MILLNHRCYKAPIFMIIINELRGKKQSAKVTTLSLETVAVKLHFFEILTQAQNVYFKSNQ